MSDSHFSSNNQSPLPAQTQQSLVKGTGTYWSEHYPRQDVVQAFVALASEPQPLDQAADLLERQTACLGWYYVPSESSFSAGLVRDPVSGRWSLDRSKSGCRVFPIPFTYPVVDVAWIYADDKLWFPKTDFLVFDNCIIFPEPRYPRLEDGLVLHRLRYVVAQDENLLTSYDGSFNTINQVIARYLNVPVAPKDLQVLDIVQSDGHWRIVTDCGSFDCPASSQPLYQVGDRVTAGSFLSDAVVWTDPDRPETYPLAVVLPSRTGQGMIPFVNQMCPVTSTVGPTSIVHAKWITGHPQVEDMFVFQQTYETTSGQPPLAELMDLRPHPRLGPTQPYQLPSQINPLKFLFQLLQRALAVLRVQAPIYNNGKIDFQKLLHILLSVLPPNMTIQIEVNTDVSPEELLPPDDADVESYYQP